MKLQISMCAIVTLFIILGFSLQSDPYRLHSIGAPADQLALDHRDSAYSHISWVTSDAGNFAQLRFFDKVEGGVCLEPSWDDYAALNDSLGDSPDSRLSLKHLLPTQAWPAKKAPGPTWPSDKAHPDPGTLPHTRYVCLFPAAVLLNKSVMQAAGGDHKKAAPNIIIVGLGSAVGISVLAHHFPEASITVVDIDQVVIDMVHDHYPFIDWLTTQKCSDGRPRLKIVARDARQYLHYADMRQDNGMKYDIVILDAYTSGSTIPSHLMTQEFFEQIRRTLTDDGILMSNIIGSYTGKKKHVVGGAMRSMHAAGLTNIHNLPVLSHPSTSKEFIETDNNATRNNIMLASPYPLSPSQRKKAWKSLNAFTMYPELKTKKYITELVTLVQKNRYITPQVSSIDFSGPMLNNIRKNAVQKQKEQFKKQKTFAKNDDVTNAYISDAALIEACQTEVLKKWHGKVPTGWKTKVTETIGLIYARTDHVLFVRRCFERSIAAARKKDGSMFIHSMQYVTGVDGEEERKRSLNPTAPLFTDAQPNADIYNR